MPNTLRHIAGMVAQKKSLLIICSSATILVLGLIRPAISSRILQEEVEGGDGFYSHGDRYIRRFHGSRRLSFTDNDVEMKHDRFLDVKMDPPETVTSERRGESTFSFRNELSRLMLHRLESPLQQIPAPKKILSSTGSARSLMKLQKSDDSETATATETSSIVPHKQQPIFYMDYSGPKTHPPSND
eukprot:c47165_g1_i1 orf=416-973(-)